MNNSSSRILALNPFHSGSHRQFIAGWQQHSRHTFDLLTLPGRHFKYRMRQSAVTFAEQVRARFVDGARWDVLWTTDMLNLAEFKGLCPQLRDVACVVYFHENQLTYPLAPGQQRDYQFAFTNFTSCLAADAVWFNSAYHRDAFLPALASYLRRMPKPNLAPRVAEIRARAEVLSPGIDVGLDLTKGGQVPQDSPLHIVWPHRWEHDKGPERLFAALKQLQEQGTEFVVSVLGETFRAVPPIFAEARQWLGPWVANWGFAKSRADYLEVLAQADVVVSTADHEFFGIAVLEAVARGCLPVVPERLAYPETLAGHACFYDGSVEALVAELTQLAAAKVRGQPLWDFVGGTPHSAIERYTWPTVVADMDAAITRLVQGSQ